MDYRNLFNISLLCLLMVAVEPVVAQPPGGDSGGFAGRMLRRLDRDENGSLDPDELEQAGPLRDYLERHDVDVSRPVPLGVIADHQTGMFQEMRERGEFPGGPPGGGGPFGGGPPGAPPASDDRRGPDGGRRGEMGRSDNNSNSNSRDDRRAARSGRRGEGSGPGGAPNGTPGKADSKSKVRVGRVGAKANLPPATLPAAYASRDINQDGQIGMYEWSRTDLSSFRKLDLNGDGFLTPAELLSPASGTGSTAVASGPSSGGKAGSGSAKPAASNEPPADLKTVAAQGAFVPLDTDKDGQLSADEFGRSRYAKKLFTEAKVELKFPLSKSTFVETYKKLAP